MKKFFFILFITIFSISCKTNLQLTSIIDEESSFYDKTNFLIIADLQDLNSKMIIENSCRDLLIEYNKNVYTDINLFSPLKKFTKLEKEKIIEEKKIDFIIRISVIENPFSTTSASTFISSHLTTAFSTTANDVCFEITIKEVKTGKLVMKGTTNINILDNYLAELGTEIAKTYLQKQFNEITEILLNNIQSIDKNINVNKKKNIYIISNTTEICRINSNSKGITLSFLKPENFFNDNQNFLVKSTFYAEGELDYSYEGTLKYFNELDYILDLIKQACVTE